jgi:glycosyltransferase 2 family protein
VAKATRITSARRAKRGRVAAYEDAVPRVTPIATVRVGFRAPPFFAMNRRFALIQALVSLVALAAVVWWATKQESPHIPTGGDAVAWVIAGLMLYVLATLVRAERWYQILELTGVHPKRADCYALTTVGYMGNNVLPARAGEALRVVLMSPRCDASKRTLIGSIVAERVLDVIALLTIFVVTVYGVLSTSEVLPTDRPLLVTGIGIVLLLGAVVAIWVLRRHHVFERVRDWLRPMAESPRALLSRTGVALLAGTFVLWTIEASVYWTVARAVDMEISITGALYLVALTNFVAALPAAPGSIGTFDAAVAFGANALGATGSQALSYVILIRFVLYVPITLVGLLVLVTRYGGWSRLRSATRLEASRA